MRKLKPSRDNPKKKRSFRDLINSHNYTNNAYTQKYGTASRINRNSPQYPKKMWRPKKVDPSKLPPTEETLDLLLAPSKVQEEHALAHQGECKTDDPSRASFRSVELVHRHRYGDDLDILRASFTKTPEELEEEKFQLILASRRLCSKIFWSLASIPKHEKYVLGGDIRKIAFSALSDSIAIKKRFYRKNMLEQLDISMEQLRELYRLAREVYPTWVTEEHLDVIFRAINEVGGIIGGLLKSSVV